MININKIILLIAITVLAAVIGACRCPAMTFTDSGQSLAIMGPQGGLFADVDKDGDEDIVTCSTLGMSQIWLNNGTGVFTNSGQTLGACPESAYQLLRDLDGDGDLDLVQGGAADGVTIKLNNGSGVFTDSGQSLDSGGSTQIVALDFDGDNDLDLVEANSVTTTRIWLNNGHGIFTLSSKGINENNVFHIKSADFNRDGIQDVALTNGSAIKVYYMDGAGDFKTAPSSISSDADALCVNDFDGDGKDDIAAFSPTGANKLLRTHTSPSQSYEDMGATFGGYQTNDCMSADLNNDGYVDIIQATQNNGVQLWLNDGSMGFTATQPIGFNNAKLMGIADVDGDGDNDIVLFNPDLAVMRAKIYLNDTANPGGGNVANAAPAAPVLTPVGTPTARTFALSWSAPADDHTPQSLITYSVRVATQTGKYNIYSGLQPDELGNVRGTSFTVHNLADGTYYWAVQAVDSADKKSAWSAENSFTVSLSFTEAASPVKLTGATQTAQFAVGDFDGDGDADLFVASAVSSARKLYINDGTGNLTDSGQNFTSTTAQAADVDNDGDLDVIGNNAVWKNNGTGTLTSTGQSLNLSEKFCAVDVDGDGDIDIVGGGGDKVWINNGLGTFAPSGQSPFGLDVSVVCGDFDGDGHIDAAVLAKSEYHMKIWKNDGTGNFGAAASQTLHIISSFEDFTAADVDGDGDLDIAPSSGYTLINTNGTFAESAVTVNPGFPLSVTTGDIDNDGDIDVFASAPPGGSGVVWKNGGAGSFTPLTEIFMAPGYGGALAMADINGDGYLDILTSGGVNYINDTHNGPGGNAPVNTAPAQPSVIHHANSATSTVTLTWNQGTDAQTPNALITYNVKVGTSSGAGNIYSGKAPIGPGAVGAAESLTLHKLPNATIFWSVQAVDTGYKTSTWSAEDTFTVNVPFTLTDSGQTIGSADTNGIFVGNLDANASPDAVTANNGANGIWTNNGAASFTEAQTLGAENTRASAGADFDGDGDIDLVFGNNGASDLWLNNGSGSFTKSAQVFDSADTRTVAAADVDGDGDMDIVFGNNAAAATIWLNDGHAVFTKSVMAFNASVTNAITAEDFDRDGDIDLLMSNEGGNKLWLNNGSGMFTDSGQTPGTGISLSGAAVDVDGDGDTDFIQGTDNGTKVWLNNGSGTFTDSGQTLGSGQVKSLAIGDLDHDGDPDIFAAVYGASSKVWLNNGSGVFTDLGGNYAGGNVTSAQAADLDGDKDLDIFLGIAGGGNKILLNNVADVAGGNSPNVPPTTPAVNAVGSPSLTTITLTWSPATDSVTPMNQLTYNLRVGRSSGANDIFSGAIGAGPGNAGATTSHTITNLYPGTYYWSVQAVDGDYARSAWSAEDTFNNVVPFKDSGQTLGNAMTRGITAADFDGDTDIDVFTGNNGASAIWLNNGSGVFTNSGQSLGSDSTMAAFAGDLDGDGDIDIVKAEYTGAAHVYFNNAGTFTVSTQTIDFSGQNVFSVTGTDVDRDGDLDLVFGVYNNTNKIWLNDGTGHFTLSNAVIPSSNTYWLAAADLNGDGAPDLVDAAFTGVKIWFNDGTGAFTGTGTPMTPINARIAITADVDADGDQDIIRSGGKIYVLKNDGHGNFTDSGQQLTVANSINYLAAADVDIDGDFDIVAGTTGGTLIFLNNGSGVFTDSKQVLGPNDTRGTMLADFDGDSDLDIFAGNYNQPSKFWTNLRISSGSPVSPNTAPTAPVPHHIASRPPGAVNFKWDAGSDTQTPAVLLRYDLRVGTGPGLNNVYSGAIQSGFTTAGATTSFIIDVATGTYYWAVRTVDSGQLKSAWSTEDSFTTTAPDTSPPAFAGAGSASDTALGGSVDLSWTAATDDTPPISYNVYYRTATSSYNFMSPATSTTDTSCRVSGLTNGVQYTFIVRARDALGHEDLNAIEKSATPTASTGPTAPKAPTGLIAALQDTTAILTWTAPTQNTDNSPLTDLAGYNVYRGATCPATAKLNTNLIATATYTDSTLASDTLYFYSVKAVNSAQTESEASGCAQVATFARGVQGTVLKYDMAGGTVAGTGYPSAPVQGLNIKLLRLSDSQLVQSAVTGANGYFFVPLAPETPAGVHYKLVMEVSQASGYMTDFGQYTGGLSERTILDDLTIDSGIVSALVRKVGTGPAIGDANCDAQIDSDDFLVLRQAYGVSKGDTGYNVNADFNGDETVDSDDFLILRNNYGASASPLAPPSCPGP